MTAAHATTATAKREATATLTAAGIAGEAIRANAKVVVVHIDNPEDADRAADVLGGRPTGLTSGAGGTYVEVAR